MIGASKVFTIFQFIFVMLHNESLRRPNLPTPSVFHPEELLDWSFIRTMSPGDFVNDPEKIKYFAQNFVSTDRFTFQTQDDLILLLKMLQNLVLSYQNQPEVAPPAQHEDPAELVPVVVGVECPVCHKFFKSMEYLDKHIINRHPEKFCAWKELRGSDITNIPEAASYGPSEFKSVVSTFKATVDSTDNIEMPRSVGMPVVQPPVQKHRRRKSNKRPFFPELAGQITLNETKRSSASTTSSSPETHTRGKRKRSSNENN